MRSMTVAYAIAHQWNGRCLGRPQRSCAAAAEAADEEAEAAESTAVAEGQCATAIAEEQGATAVD